MKKNKVLAILVNYNGTELTKECISSLNESNMDVDIFIVDNASTNNDIERVACGYSNVVLYKSETNLGFSGANNIGIKYAIENEYPYVMLLNNDTIVDNCLVQTLYKKCSDSEVTVPCIYYYDQPTKINYAGGKVNRFTGTVKHFKDDNHKLRYRERNCTFATGCCVMMTINTVRKVGLLDEKFFMYCEDADYSIRLINNGIRIKYVPEAKLWHKIGATSGNTQSPICVYYGSRNRLYLINKYPLIFKKTAIIYTHITRIIHFILLKIKKNPSASLYIKAIRDYHNGVMGKVDLL